MLTQGTPLTKLTKEEQEQYKKEEELRNKSWEELDINEKVERMRIAIKQKESRLSRQVSRVDKDVSSLIKHSHKDNGDIVVPLRESCYGEGGCEQSLSSQKVWF